ncbi:uncharacterized protein LOC113291855 [Papaver somniferum]|uniref:uncharacterized protein LOC113291855 n=1 Tax=Papaver somniferum TaxID=3469 RepID=UPI000E6FBEFE|nr:uncharacterized protein LOC113291855 [Papaver somniferum]
MSQPPTPISDLYRFYDVVEELYLPNSSLWNIDLLNKLFDAATSMKIQALFIDISKEDVMIWSPFKDGKFSVKSTYKLLTLNNSDIQVNGISINPKAWKNLWNCSAAQRIKLFSWKCIRGLNIIKIKRAQCNSSLDTQCDICGYTVENIEHIIFHCKHAKEVWKGVNINIDTISESFNSISEWVLSWFDPDNNAPEDSKLFLLMISIWVLWKDKCDVVFQGVKLNSISSVHKISYHLASHLRTYKISNASTRIISSFNSSWKPPPNGIFKLDVDGFFDYNTNQYVIGVVIRDHTGTFLGIKWNYGDGALNPEEAECMAVLEALFCALERNFSSIQIEADAKLVIESIKSSNLLTQWENRNLINEIQYLISKFLF